MNGSIEELDESNITDKHGTCTRLAIGPPASITDPFLQSSNIFATKKVMETFGEQEKLDRS